MLKLITELTEEQKAKIPEYYDRYLKLGYSLTPVVHKDAEEAVTASFVYLKEKKPKFIWVSSMEQAFIVGACLAKNLSIKECGKDPAILKEEHKPTDSEIAAQRGAVCAAPRDAYWLARYAFIQNELDVEKSDLFPLVQRIIETCGNYIPFSDCVVMVERPLAYHMTADGKPHNPNGRSLEYPDGTGYYHLNGIKMKKWMVMTPAEEISVADIMKVENIDQRRELLRKVGLERFVKETNAKTLDSLTVNVNNKACEYRLLEVTLVAAEGQAPIFARVLKMDNPSINAIHIEGVEDTCNTVKEALAWRNGFDSFNDPIALS